ncbi:MAG: lipocalin family protein [Eubacteriales bacterium]|nr:lipocalin family protein [Eubacteriales bacterium]
MKKKGLIFLIVVLILVLIAGLVVLFKTGGDDKESANTAKEQTVEESQDENEEEAEPADDESENEDKDAEDDSQDEDDQNASIDAQDPGDYDPTDVSKNAEPSKLEKDAIGTWSLQGIRYSDGSLQSDGTSCTYTINSDGTYTANGKNAKGKSFNTNGKWKVKNGKVVLGSDKLGFDDDGELLKFTGDRDGKGYKLFYVYTKK